MSKIDELMALVDKHADAHHHDECGHFPEGASRPLRAALQDALNAVVQDAERYRWLRSQREWHEMNQTQDAMWTCEMPPGEVDAAIDAARKP